MDKYDLDWTARQCKASRKQGFWEGFIAGGLVMAFCWLLGGLI